MKVELQKDAGLLTGRGASVYCKGQLRDYLSCRPGPCQFALITTDTGVEGRMQPAAKTSMPATKEPSLPDPELIP